MNILLAEKKIYYIFINANYKKVCLISCFFFDKFQYFPSCFSIAETQRNDLEESAKQRIEELEMALVQQTAHHAEQLQQNLQAYNIQLAEHEVNLNLIKDKEVELLKRISELSSTENELREKVHASETEFGERLRAASMRERELLDRINQLVSINKEAEEKERQLEEQLTLSNDEIVVVRHSTRSSLDAANSPRISSDRPQMLQDEVESLRCVLGLKQSEISELRKQNHELVKDADALPVAIVKISGLESRLEDLDIQLKTKCEDEK